MLGRLDEQREIDGVLGRAKAGLSGALFVTGDAGIGKSALLDYAESTATGWRVLRTRGVESEAAFPFGALQMLLRPALSQIDRLPVGQAIALRGACRLTTSAICDRFLVGLAALTLLSELGDEPVLCLIDDTQWMDHTSLDALTLAARRLYAEGIAMIFAGRGSVPAYGIAELALDGIGEEAAAALLAEDLPPQVRGKIITEGRGNPLALLELSAQLTPRQREGRLSGLPSYVDTGAPTRRVQRAFHEQIIGLPEATQTALLIVAADDTVELAVLLRAAKRLGCDAADLAAAERATMIHVTADGAVTFRHPLIQSAAYHAAPYFRRQAAHLALAEVLGDSHPDRRAWHRAAGRPAPDECLSRELAGVAIRARFQQDAAAASAAFERAAEFTAVPGRRAELLLSAAEQAMHAGQLPRVERLAARVEEPADPARLARVNAWMSGERGDPGHAARSLVEGARRVVDPEVAAKLLGDAIRAASLGGNATIAREAEATLRALALPASEMLRGMATVTRLIEGGLVTDLADLRTTAVQLATSPAMLPLASSLSLVAGEERTARDLAARFVARCRDRGWIGVLPDALALLAQAQLLCDQHAEAAAAAQEALAISCDTHQQHRVGQISGVLAWLAAVRGDGQSCLDLAARASRDVPSVQAIAAWAVGLHHLAACRWEQARAHLMEVSAKHAIVGLFAAPDLVEAAVRSGRPAEQAARGFEEWAAAVDRPWATSLAARLKAITANRQVHFEEALGVAADQPFQTARTRLLYGEWLRRERRRGDARRELRMALDLFDQLGAGAWRARASAELGATGVTAPLAGGRRAESLTPRERQVALLAAEGLSNRQIGSRLFLSPRTVGHHLSNAFRKLGIASREELAGVMTDMAPP
ncbi:LuxR family transcriptional regulator [Nonomuraea rosea]|uniref:LuxR family transcriptional regulator n=1 Tax=Nonomuraea rosea TaxID=638574 RepID=A0ABP6ZAI8_9ACTN